MISRPMVRSRKGLRPTRSASPREAQGIAGEPGDGAGGLLELPRSNLRIAAEGFEKGYGRFVDRFLGDGFRPLARPAGEVGSSPFGGGASQEKIGEVSKWIPAGSVHLKTCWRMTRENAS
jgi:hypothetical protein